MKITKTVRFPVVYDQSMQKGEKALTFQEFCREAWDCQKEIRAALNAASSVYQQFIVWKMDFYDQNKRRPNAQEQKDWYLSADGCSNSLEAVLDHAAAKKKAKVGSKPVYSAIHDEISKWNKLEKDFFSGQRAFPSFKGNQPISIAKEVIRFDYLNHYEITVTFPFLSDEHKRYLGLKHDQKFIFLCSPSKKDRGTISILNQIINGIYHHGAGALSYDMRKKKWFFSCSYTFEKDVDGSQIDPSIILGVDLGVNTVAYCAVSDSEERYHISGDEVKEFRRRVEKRRISMLKALPYQSGGKVGHGTKCRVEKAYELEDKIARFRDTKNKQYADKIVDFAVAHHCGIIQMEDLTGVRDTAPEANAKKKKSKGKKKSADEAQNAMNGTESFGSSNGKDADKEERKKENRMLGHWTFYDLKQRIEMKAAEYGIQVVSIPPAYTSQMCSFCHHISSDSRPATGEGHKWFTCVNCGRKLDADYNAARNLSIAGIEAIIAEQLEKQKKEAALVSSDHP